MGRGQAGVLNLLLFYLYPLTPPFRYLSIFRTKVTWLSSVLAGGVTELFHLSVTFGGLGGRILWGFSDTAKGGFGGGERGEKGTSYRNRTCMFSNEERKKFL